MQKALAPGAFSPARIVTALAERGDAVSERVYNGAGTRAAKTHGPRGGPGGFVETAGPPPQPAGARALLRAAGGGGSGAGAASGRAGAAAAASAFCARIKVSRSAAIERSFA